MWKSLHLFFQYNAIHQIVEDEFFGEKRKYKQIYCRKKSETLFIQTSNMNILKKDEIFEKLFIFSFIPLY